jgi:hypothetical protein
MSNSSWQCPCVCTATTTNPFDPYPVPGAIRISVLIRLLRLSDTCSHAASRCVDTLWRRAEPIQGRCKPLWAIARSRTPSSIQRWLTSGYGTFGGSKPPSAGLPLHVERDGGRVSLITRGGYATNGCPSIRLIAGRSPVALGISCRQVVSLCTPKELALGEAVIPCRRPVRGLHRR